MALHTQDGCCRVHVDSPFLCRDFFLIGVVGTGEVAVKGQFSRCEVLVQKFPADGACLEPFSSVGTLVIRFQELIQRNLECRSIRKVQAVRSVLEVTEELIGILSHT